MTKQEIINAALRRYATNLRQKMHCANEDALKTARTARTAVKKAEDAAKYAAVCEAEADAATAVYKEATS